MSIIYSISSWINPFHDNSSWLASAVKEGNVELVNTTLAAGADPNFIQKENNGCEGNKRVTVLYIAVENKHADIAKILLDAGANPNDLSEVAKYGSYWVDSDDVEIALNPAVRNNDTKMVDLLLSYGANPNSTYEDMNNQPLSEAVTLNHLPIAELLLAHGAEVDHATCHLIYENGYFKDRVCETPLYKANTVEMAKLLIANDAALTGTEYINIRILGINYG